MSSQRVSSGRAAWHGPRRWRPGAGRAPVGRLGRRPPPRQQAVRLGDRRAVPQGAVLLAQRDEGAVGGLAGRRPGVVEQHQRHQRPGLGRGEAASTSRARRMASSLRSRRVSRARAAGRCIPFVEDQVQHGQHAGQPLVELLRGRDLQRDGRGADLLLGPRDPLPHGRLGDDEGPGDLGRAEAAERPQGEGHPARRRPAPDGSRRTSAPGARPRAARPPAAWPGRPALARRSPSSPASGRGRRCRLLAPADGGAPQPVDRPPPADGDQPAARVGRHAVDRPAVERRGGGVLQRLLRQVDVAQRRASTDRTRPGSSRSARSSASCARTAPPER